MKFNQLQRVLFVCYGGGHASIIKELVSYLLIVDDQIEIFVLPLTGALNEFDNFSNRISILKLSDYVNDPKAINYGEELLNGLERSPANIMESVAYLGQSYLELVANHGKSRAKVIYSEMGRRAFLPLMLVDRIFEHVSPNLLVTTNSPRMEKASLIVAKKRGLKAISIIDLFPMNVTDWIDGTADKICVFSSRVKQKLIDEGVSPNKVIVSGNPVFDHYLNKRRNDRLSYGKRILWASQQELLKDPVTGEKGNLSLPTLIENELIKLNDSVDDWCFTFRQHPGEAIREYPNSITVSSKDEPLQDLLADIDLVITMRSTVGVQAACMGIPVIAVRGSIADKYGTLDDLIDCSVANDVSEIKSIAQVILNRDPKITLEIPEGATQNIYIVMKELLNA